ncbi:MAG: hypothetical protein BGO98_49645 [Myxococcales bacterium 68-20]|nr:hypothetical protein [Myxococcales bacterium]OJY29879.1 MAG: hypothetical protein BGO98_49645 [Myxococcales bacterium 68-20]
MKVALATCTTLPAPDADQALLVGALEDAGASVRLLAWDDPMNAPDAGELVVIRSTWNYFEDVDGFLAWVERTAKTTHLFNPASIVRQNARKTYLRDLSRRGIDVVPTEYAMKGDARSIPDVTRERGWDAIVIKPVVSAGSFSTQRFAATEAAAAQRFLDELTRERDAMIQPWMPSVDTYGERSLVWIDGELTHAIRKSPRFSGSTEAVSAAMPIAPEERAFAEKVLEPIATDLLYARVDVVRDENGVLRLMELELIEPSLYLVQCPPALARLTRAIVRRATADMA